jgi:hypothetical protein
MTKLVKAAVVIGILTGLTGCTLPRCSLPMEGAAGFVASFFGG